MGRKAHKDYLRGLKETGISISRIPKIEEINSSLNKFSWHAVCVRGFIPPLVFLEFQSRNILPIAADMRTLENIAYTSAPDIVHEGAGHAPFIANNYFRSFLERYALVSSRSFFSKEDMDLYGAIRRLSDMKENKDYSKEDIKQVEKSYVSVRNQSLGFRSK